MEICSDQPDQPRYSARKTPFAHRVTKVKAETHLTSSRHAKTMTSDSSQKVYIVEHLDPELEAWSSLEYKTIAAESQDAGSLFYLSSVPSNLQVPDGFRESRGLLIEQRGVEELFAHKKERVCLLDPAAKVELAPEDGERFDVFLFGGILGDDPPRGKLWDEFAVEGGNADDDRSHV